MNRTKKEKLFISGKSIIEEKSISSSYKWVVSFQVCIFQPRSLLDNHSVVMYVIHYMKRTQIYFPKELHNDLKVGAAIMKVSMSEYIRKLLEESLYSRPLKNKPLKKKASLMILADNAVNFGIKDLSKNFRKYSDEALR